MIKKTFISNLKNELAGSGLEVVEGEGGFIGIYSIGRGGIQHEILYKSGTIISSGFSYFVEQGTKAKINGAIARVKEAAK
jgi:hypothetical protein